MDNLIWFLIILGIIAFFLFRRKKGVSDFENKVPNFISFCKLNGWKLDAQDATGLLFCKEVDYEKLKTEYLNVNKEQIELPENMIIYHYIGLYCGGEFISISTDNRNFSDFRFINYLTVPNFKPGQFPKKYLSNFKDENVLYETILEAGWNEQVRELYSMIQSDKINRNGYGGGWYSLYMKEQELQLWTELANDSEVPLSMRSAISELFIPYKISIKKFHVNQDATSDPFRYLMYDTNTLFSKTLKIFQQNPTLKAVGYPNWFYLAFPDVALWAIKGNGNKIIKEQFNNLSEDELISDNIIRLKYIKKIINLYSQNTAKVLEVSIYSDY